MNNLEEGTIKYEETKALKDYLFGVEEKESYAYECIEKLKDKYGDKKVMKILEQYSSYIDYKNEYSSNGFRTVCLAMSRYKKGGMLSFVFTFEDD